MYTGTAVDRQWIIVLNDGSPVLDWGNGTGVDLMSGDPVQCEGLQFGHAIQDGDLDLLKRAGRISGYDARKVYVISLPELPHRSLES